MSSSYITYHLILTFLCFTFLSSYLSLLLFCWLFYLLFSLFIFEMTTWPSGLRRVTRNHFSSGGVGSNPAVVVFLFLFKLIYLNFYFTLFFLLFYFYLLFYLSIILFWCFYSFKNGPTQIRTGVPRTRISYAAPTPWDLYILLFLSLFFLLFFLFFL